MTNRQSREEKNSNTHLKCLNEFNSCYGMRVCVSQCRPISWFCNSFLFISQISIYFLQDFLFRFFFKWNTALLIFRLLLFDLVYFQINSKFLFYFFSNFVCWSSAFINFSTKFHFVIVACVCFPYGFAVVFLLFFVQFFLNKVIIKYLNIS